MKKLIFVFLILIAFANCAKNEISSAKTQSKENTISNSLIESNETKLQSDFSFEKLISSQKTSSKILKWIAPLYNEIQLGKATQNDVITTFGEPKDQFHPFSEYESTKGEWTFYYENINNFDGSVSFTFNIRSKMLNEVWLRPNDEKPLTIEKAIEIYGKDYFLRGVGKNICSSKKLTKIEYPFTIVYPQKGIFLWGREGEEVTDIFYIAKCP